MDKSRYGTHFYIKRVKLKNKTNTTATFTISKHRILDYRSEE